MLFSIYVSLTWWMDAAHYFGPASGLKTQLAGMQQAVRCARGLEWRCNKIHTMNTQWFSVLNADCLSAQRLLQVAKPMWRCMIRRLFACTREDSSSPHHRSTSLLIHCMLRLGKLLMWSPEMMVASSRCLCFVCTRRNFYLHFPSPEPA